MTIVDKVMIAFMTFVVEAKIALGENFGGVVFVVSLVVYIIPGIIFFSYFFGDEDIKMRIISVILGGAALIVGGMFIWYSFQI